MVAARTVIAQAISPSGSLWLGCRPRDRPQGDSLGEVELYMFRMWNDLDHHGVCEDGTVIGWSAQYWGLTSPRARQRDPDLLCVHRRLRRKARGINAPATPGPTSSPVIVVTHVSNQTSQVTGPQLINCDIRQFCSQKNAYFWMSIRVKVKEGDKNEQDVQTLVSDAFGCSGNSDTASDNMDFCLAVEVNCVAKSQISTTTCDVLLQRSVAVSACEVQREGVSALQTVGDEQIEVKITREVERVGRYHCEDTAPSSGGFVRCASTSSLEDICQANKASTVTCSLIEPDSNPDLQPVSKSCSRRGPLFCDCTAFCKSKIQRQFFATRINITSDAVNVDVLKSLLSRPWLAQSCGTTSNCQDSYEKVHLECHGTQKRLFSCMVILEMSGPVDICSLNESLQELIDSNANITNVRPLTRIMICGPPDLSVDALLKSNLTWVDSDLLNSNVCQPDLLECEENEVRAVLLNESCPHTTRQTTTQPSTLTKTSITATPVTTATEHTNTEAGKTNASRSTVQPNMTTPLAEINSTQSSTREPGFQTSSQNTSSSVNSTLQITTTALIDSTLNTTTLSPSHITVYNETTASTLRPSPSKTSTTTSNSTIGTFTPSPTLVNNVTTTTKNNTTASNKLTKAYNVTTAHNNRNLHNGTTTLSNTTVDTFTASPNHTADDNVTTINVKQHNSTVTTDTTISTFTSSPNYTITTTTRNYTTASKHDTTELTTVDQQNGTTLTSNATIITSTTSPNHTVVYSGTTASNNYTTDYSNGSITTFSTFTPSPSYNVTTATKKHTTDSNNYTTVYNVTTASNNYTTQYNVSTADRNPQKGTNTTGNTTVYTAGYNVTTTTSYVKQHNSTVTATNTTMSTFTSPNYTTVNNVTTATKNYTTVDNNGNQQNGTTTTSTTTISTFTSPNPTVVYNVTTPASNNTTVYNVTTPSNNYTTDYNAMTTDNNNYTTTTSNATISTYTSSPNYTMVNNVTTATKNYTTHFNNYTTQYNGSTANIRNIYNGTTTSNTTVSTFTTPNPTVVYNVTTSTSNNTTEYNVTTPSNIYTTDYNAMTADNNNRTSTTSNATISTSTASPNYTMVNNVTTATKNYTTHFNNYTTQYNRFIANIRNLQNGTTTTRSTTVSTFTPSSNHTEVYNKTTNSIYVRQHNSTVTTADATISTFTSSPNYTVVNNVTTAIKNHTTAFNNYTTVHNNGKQQNTTNTSNATISTYTASVYNATTAASNYTTQHNVTASNSNTTEYNVTTAGNIRNLQNGTSTTSNTTFSTSNHTADYNLTTTSRHVKQHNSTVTTTSTTMSTFTTSPNYTMAGKITTATKNYTTSLNNYTTDNNNGIITTSNTNTSTFTPSPSLSYTTVNNVTTVSHKYTTAENVTIKTLFQNKRTTYNVTTATPHRNMTTSTAATSKNSTVDNMTAVVDNTTKSAVAPLNNQTANHTTARMTYTTTTGKNDTSSTTAANGSIDHNETAGTGLNLSTTDLNLTTKPLFSFTTMVASTTRGPPSTTTTTTTGTTATTTTTTTITSTSTTITKPDTGATSTSTAKTTESQEAREEAANELLVQTQNVSQLNSSQVAQLTGQLEKLLDGPTVSQAVGQKAVNIISNLMEGDAQALTASANRLIRLVDDLGFKLVVTGDKEIVSSTSLVLAVKTVDGINFPTTSVDILNTDNVQFSDTSRSPALGSVYLPSSLTTGLRPEEQQQASRVQFTYFTKSTLFQDATLDNQTSVSPILGSSVANLSISNLSENISFTIRMINFPQKNYTASCVFWNFSLHDGLGGWSSNGCSVVNTTSEETTCSCNHLTSFAILLDLSRDGLQDRQQVQILTFITYIGCGLSAVFLAVTLLTYLSFEKLLRDIPAKILVQLCISLLLLNLLFLLDGWLAIYPVTGLCISTAFFLHYFLLTSFTWAGLEALHMYLSVIRVFTPYLSRYMLKFSLMGWGIPLIVVIVVISVDKDNYGLVTYGKYIDGTTDDFCWLRNNIAFYVAVVGYFVLIFALCLLVFIMVMVQLARIKRQNPQNQSPNRGVMTDMRSIAGLVILLGLTWGFALFAWGPLYLPFVYLFTIFNTLQGFLVFVFHCAVKENVRRQWRTYLCCGRLRLAENSEWSRTATQNTKNIPGATATASAPRLPSRSSSVISDGTNSNGSMYLDSGISDCTGSDVVLNEIHRQSMSP